MDNQFGAPIEGHNQLIEKEIFNRYRELRKTDYCLKCKEEIADRNVNCGAVSLFNVGNKFGEVSNLYDLLFVGKTVQDEWDTEPTDVSIDFIDARFYSKKLWDATSVKSPIWECMAQVSSNLWGVNKEENWRRIAFSNIVKCSVSKGHDKPETEMMKNCISNVGYLDMEIQVMKPSHVILFTGPQKYDSLIKQMKISEKAPKIDQFTSKRLVKNSQEADVAWWQRTFELGANRDINILRTNHPGWFALSGKKELLEPFSRLIADWVRNPTML